MKQNTHRTRLRFGALLVVAGLFAVLSMPAPAGRAATQATPEAGDPCATLVDTGQSGAGHGSMMAAGTPMMGMAGMMDADFDLMFIDMMIPHHQEAIDMAQVVLNRSSNDEIRALAEEVIEAQQREVELMAEWRETWYPDAGDPIEMTGDDMMGFMGEYGEGIMMMAAGEMLAELCQAEDVDHAFSELMIPHHLSAIAMAEAALATSEREEVRELAQAVIDAQTQEVLLLQRLVEALTGTPVAAG
jgi:uncharacterized protein (DUF305 family)